MARGARHDIIVFDLDGTLSDPLVGIRERYGQIGYAENVLYPGVATAFERLRDADIPLAVCTSKRRDFAARILDLQAAHRNRLHAAAVLWGYGSAAELAHEQPRYSFTTASEILELVE